MCGTVWSLRLGGGDGVEIIQYGWYLRPASLSHMVLYCTSVMHYMCGTIKYIILTYSIVPWKNGQPNYHHHFPKTHRGLSEVESLWWMVMVMVWEGVDWHGSG
jgi:hypothetical protein